MIKRALRRRVTRRADLVYNKDSGRSFASESDSGLRDHGKHPANPRLSRFTVSLIVPHPEQHTVFNSSITGGRRDDAIRSDFTATQNITSSASNTKKNGAPAKADIKLAAPSSGSSTIKPSDQSGSSVIRLDIVREDAEREQGATLSPRRHRSASDNGMGREGERGGAERVASARSDSTAKELLKWYTDEQVFPEAN